MHSQNSIKTSKKVKITFFFMVFYCLLFSRFFSCDGYLKESRQKELESKGYQKIVDFSKNSFLYENDIYTVGYDEDVHTLQNNNDGEEKTVFISKNLAKDKKIATSLLQNGFIVSHTFENQKYIITDEKTQYSDNFSIIENFDFISNLECTIHIYTNNPIYAFAHELKKNSLLLIFFIFITVFTSGIFYRKIRYKKQDSNIYIFTETGKHLFGKKPDFPNDFFKNEFEAKIKQLIDNKDANCVGIYTFYNGYEESKDKFNIPLIIGVKENGIIKVISTDFTPLKHGKTNISADLNGKKANNVEIHELEDDSCNILMNFDDEKDVIMKIPALSFIPFLPRGRDNFIFNTFISLLDYDENIQKNKTNLKDYFSKLLSKFSKEVGVLRVAILNGKESQKITYQYTDESLKPLQEEEIIAMSEKDRNFDFNDCAVTFHQSYEAILTSAEIIVGVASPTDDCILKAIYRILLQSYQTIENKERRNRFTRINNLIEAESKSNNEAPFEIIEAVDGIIRNHIGSEDQKEIGKQLSDYIKCSSEQITGEENKKKFLDFFKVLDESDTSIHQDTFECIKDGAKLYYTITCFTQYDETIKANVTMIFKENITTFKKKEEKLYKLANQMKVAYEALNLHKFQYIPDEGKLIVSERFFKTLGIDAPEDLNLMPRIFKDDIEKITTNSTIRILDAEGNLSYYSLRSEGNRGFIFCSNEMVKMENELETAKNELDLFKCIRYPYCIFIIDAENDKFVRILKYKTPFDVIGVKESALSKLPDYILEGKEEIIELFEQIKHKQYENGQHDFLMKTPEGHLWFRMSVTKTEDAMYEGFLICIDEQKKLEISLMKTQKMQELVMSSAKLSVWRFADNNEDIPIDITNMNWKTIDCFTTSDEFKKAIREALDSDGVIDQVVELSQDGEEEKWYSARGKATDHKILGIICDITELHRASINLVEEQKKAEIALKEKTLFLQSMAHGIRTPMNGIVAVLDMLSMQPLPVNQRLIVDMLKDASFRLLQELNCVLQLSKTEKHDKINSEPINILDKIEEELTATIKKMKEKGHKLTYHISPYFPSTVEGASHYFRLVFNDLSTLILQSGKDMTFCIDYNQKQQQVEMKIEKYSNDKSQSLLFEMITMMKGTYKVENEVLQVTIPFDSLLIPYINKYKEGEKHIIIYAFEKDNEERQPDEILTQRLEIYNLSIIYANSFDEIVKTFENNKQYFVEAIFIDIPYKGKQLPDKLEEIRTKVPIIFIGDSISDAYPSVAKPILPRSANSIIRSIRFNHLKKNAAEVNKQEHKDEEKKEKLKILVVEDVKQNQFIMSKLLHKIGVEFDVADNGQIAVDKVGAAKFDMIFMDCQMPVMDGLEATRVIRSREDGTSHIPIVALTASAVDGDEERCRESGMDGYIQKPFRFPQIVEAIKKYTTK